METPSWVKHFDEKRYKQNDTNNDSWPTTMLSDFTETSQTPIHHSKSYSADDSLSGSQIIPRIRTVQSSCNLADEQKKHKKRRRRQTVDETSGYSTTSLSELSEIESPRQNVGRSKQLELPNNRRKDSIDDNLSERSRVSQATSRHGSETSKTTTNSRRVSDISKGPVDRRDSPYQRRELYKNSPQRPPGRARSTTSLQSEISVKSNQSGQSRRPRSGSQQLDNRLSEDPFAFIQPVPEPFSRKMKKTLGPIFGIILLLILAASLGAAIYFAVELKKNQETEIEMLRASLDLKIKNTRFGKRLDELTQTDFKIIATDYCRQMDNFYSNSHFQPTYRGCEVVSIKNEHINFTLFFIENAASKRDIISVIETSAPKVSQNDASVALVDKFEIELENAKIKIEHQRTPINFNKIITTTTTTTTTTTRKPTTTTSTTSRATTRKPTTKMKTTTKKETTKATSKPTTSSSTSKTTTSTSTTRASKQSTTTKYTTTVITTPSTTKTTTVESPTTTDGWGDEWTEDDILYAWEPCDIIGGIFHPHPIECNRYFQCEHSASLVRTCAGDTVFDSNSNVCVPRRPGIVCPNPAMAPPMPPGHNTKAPTTPTSTSSPTSTAAPQSKTKIKRLTRPLYPARPEYEREPCVNADEGTLHAHPDDCSKFIQCITGGSGVVLTCAKNLVYDPESSSCIFPRNELICPDILPCLQKSNGYFPHPFNCSLYIQCQSGREVIQECSSGLVWEPSVNSCVFHTANAVCEQTSKKR